MIRLNTMIGYFYMIQTCPDLDPLRIKFGFSKNPYDRLECFRTSLPTAILVRSWEINNTYIEKFLIETLSTIKSRLGPEVVTISSIEDTISEITKTIDEIHNGTHLEFEAKNKEIRKTILLSEETIELISRFASKRLDDNEGYFSKDFIIRKALKESIERGPFDKEIELKRIDWELQRATHDRELQKELQKQQFEQEMQKRRFEVEMREKEMELEEKRQSRMIEIQKEIMKDMVTGSGNNISPIEIKHMMELIKTMQNTIGEPTGEL